MKDTNYYALLYYVDPSFGAHYRVRLDEGHIPDQIRVGSDVFEVHAVCDDVEGEINEIIYYHIDMDDPYEPPDDDIEEL